MSKQLRSGYTTGTHATAVLVACVYEFFNGKKLDSLEVVLPKGVVATIDVFYEDTYRFSTIKVDNDDIDVTKGAKIFCKLQKETPAKLKNQTPTLLKIDDFSLYIWAGDGVGVVTKRGLKISPNYPAINPTPLNMMEENIQEFVSKQKDTLHAVFCIEDGEKIAKDTANAKVGVVGGISILGTRGIVKPVSATAYIDSISTEIDVASAFDESVIVLTLGNSAFDFAKERYEETNIVEIGNFVYDSLKQLKKHSFKRVVFITSVAKMSKVAQGFKNTHNKFGSIDFDEVKEWVFDEFDICVEGDFLTLKGFLESFDDKYQEDFVKLISKKSALMIKEWSREIGVDIGLVEVITLPKDIRYVLQ